MITYATVQDKKARMRHCLVVLTFLAVISLPLALFARGGGGGSSSSDGGGGSSYSSGSSFHSTSAGGTATSGNPIGALIMIIFFLGPIMIIGFFVARRHRKQRKEIEKALQDAALQDPTWNETSIAQHVREIFLKFQNDWSTFNVDSMKTYLTEEYLKRMILEINVLKNENRQNLVQNPVLIQTSFSFMHDSTNNSEDAFTAEIFATAEDLLLNTETNEKLSADSTAFREHWDFLRDGGEWKLSLIRQETESAQMREPAIEDFAKRNNFFYDPDFGWLMMPNKGVIFRKSNFQTSDINNHVIGYYHDKIVEFYTFAPVPNSTNYIVAQVALPIKYNDILVKKKNKFLNSDPSGLRRIETESNDFNEKFCLWAHPDDQVSSFELLTPNFMEKIYDLPFELNIEVVGSFLYFYLESREDVDYDKMLEILSWAFDEMKK